jgi:hypothetical protein
MANNIRPLPTGQNIQGAGGVVDRFAQVSAVAKPTFDAALQLRDARAWLTKWKNRDPSFNRLLLNVERCDELDEAEARLVVIPDMAFLQQAGQLFDDAEHKSAPEPWFHLALGAMLASMPNAKNVAPDYQFGVVDMLVRDEEVWEKGCEPGFSAPVFVRAIRQVRREDEFVPAAAKILKACQQNRRHFRELGFNVTLLMQVRENAERVVSEWEIPFLSQENRQKNHIPDDDSDVPF